MGNSEIASFNKIPSRFTTEKTAYKGGQQGGMGSFPSIYLVKPEFLDLVLPEAANPNKSPDNPMKNYRPQALDARLYSKLEILKEEEIFSNNVIGTAGVMEVAQAVAMNPCKRTMVFVAWTAEEKGLLGSEYFLDSGILPKDKIKFNVNLDMIGRTGKGNEATRAHWVVTNQKCLEGIRTLVTGVNDGVTDFPVLFNDDAHSPGDDPEKIDYPKAEKVSRLAYLVAQKLGNMDAVPSFLQ